MNPIKYLKKTLVIEMGFAALPAVGAAFSGGVAATAVATGAATVGASVAGASLFGGSLLSTLSTISTIASVGSTLFGGQAEAKDYKIQAKAEENNARNREIERKRNLIRSLALQNVRAGASGITSGVGSSAQAIQMEDISRFNLDQSTDAAATGQRVSQLRQNASNATTFSLLSAGSEAVKFGRRQAKRGSV